MTVRKTPFCCRKRLFNTTKTAKHLFNYSAKKYEKLYLFMGRANKNIIIQTNSRYYRAIDGNEKIQKGTPNVRCGNRCGVGNVYCQCKNCGHSRASGDLPRHHFYKSSCRIFILFACASSPSTSASRIISSALSANFSLSYSMILVDLIKSLLLSGLKNFAVIPVGKV